MDVGFVKLENFKKSGNKINYIYILTPEGLKEKIKITRTFIDRKEMEYELLKQEIQKLKSKNDF